MKRNKKLYALFCSILGLSMPNIVYAFTPPSKIAVSDAESFCLALEDDRIAAQYTWIAEQFASGNADVLDTPFPYSEIYPFFDNGDLAHLAYEEFRAVGYVP